MEDRNFLTRPRLIVLISLLALLTAAVLLFILCYSPAEETGEPLSVEAFLRGYDAMIEESERRVVPVTEVDHSVDVRFSLDEKGVFFFNKTQTLTLSLPEGKTGEIYYTTDGSEPSRKKGRLFEKNIRLNAGETPVVIDVKAVAYYDDGTTSPVTSRTYFLGLDIKENFGELMIVSVTASESDLYSDAKGIFNANNIWGSGREWERPANVTMYEPNGEMVFSMKAGLRISGAYSRTFDQKSMRIYARTDYDLTSSYFPCPDLFGEQYQPNGARVLGYKVLNFRNAGNDFGNAYMRDEMLHTLLDLQGYTFTEHVRPCLLYLNNELYGFYWIHERYSDSYLDTRLGSYNYKGEFAFVNTNNENIIVYDGETRPGFNPLKDYKDMYAYSSKDLLDDDIYAELCELMDVESFLQLHATMMYVYNDDFVFNNVRAFRYYPAAGEDFSDVKGLDGKWYFAPHDTDWSFPAGGAATNTLGHRSWTDQSNHNMYRTYSKMYNALMQRDDCRAIFVTAMIDMMNGAFSAKNGGATVQKAIDTMYPGLSLVLNNGAGRSYGAPAVTIDPAAFLRRTGRVKTFVTERPQYMAKFLDEWYDLGKAYKIQVDPPCGSAVTINSYTVKEKFTGTYYQMYDTVLSVQVPIGYTFHGWQINDDVWGNAPAEDFVLPSRYVYQGKTLKITPILEQESVPGLWIETVTYAPGEDVVVLRNLSTNDLSTLGYALSDDATKLRSYALPVTTVKAGETLVVYGKNNTDAIVRGSIRASFDFGTGETLYVTYTDPATGETIIRDSAALYRLRIGTHLERNYLDGVFYEK